MLHGYLYVREGCIQKWHGYLQERKMFDKKILLWAYSFLERTWKLLMDILHYYEEQGYYYILVNLHTVQWKPT